MTAIRTRCVFWCLPALLLHASWSLAQSVDVSPLRTIQPDQLATTLGFRFYDRKLTVGARWIAVAAKEAGDIPDRNDDGIPVLLPSASYNLINMFLAYEPTPDVIATFAIDNILDEYYVPYLSAEQAGSDGTPGLIFPSPGRTFKGALRIRFGNRLKPMHGRIQIYVTIQALLRSHGPVYHFAGKQLAMACAARAIVLA